MLNRNCIDWLYIVHWKDSNDCNINTCANHILLANPLKVKHSWSTYSTDFSKLGPPCALCTGTEFWRLNFPKKTPSRMNNVIAMETLERHQEAIKATIMEGKIIKTKTQLLFSLCFKKSFVIASFLYYKYDEIWDFLSTLDTLY